MVYLNITIPEDLKKKLDKEVKKEKTKRSTLIQKAVRYYLHMKKQKDIETLLKEGYQNIAEASSEIMDDFAAPDQEAWDHVR